MFRKLLLLIALLAFLAPLALGQTVGSINTVAGTVPNNVRALSVGIGLPTAVAKDSSGNIYVAVESGSNENGGIFKVDTNGVLTTIVGNGTFFYTTAQNNGDGGLAVNAIMGLVTGLFVDSQQNIYVSDSSYNSIRKVTAATGIITTIAGGGTGCASETDAIGDNCPATSAVLSRPSQIFVDANQNLFIADTGNNRIRKVVASSGLMQTVAGGGTGCTAQSDTVGDGCSATLASLSSPVGVYVDVHGNIFMSDTDDFRIREVSVSTGIIQTIAGTGTAGYNGDNIAATTANIATPYGLFVDSADDVFFSDLGNGRVREVVAATGFIQTIAGPGSGCTGETDTVGDGCPASEAIISPYGIFVDSSNNLYIADPANNLVREVVASDTSLNSGDIIQAVAGNGTVFFSGDGGPATQAELNLPYGVAADGQGNIFVADLGNHRVRKITVSSGIIETVAGGGSGCTNQTDDYGDGCLATQATIYPSAVFVDAAGNVYISDTAYSLIRKVSASTGIITLVAGGGAGCANQTDTVGDGCPATQASLSSPYGLFVDSSGNIVFADYTNSRVREVVASTGIIQSIAGTGTPGYNGDNIAASSAQIYYPVGLSEDPAGNIYFSDLGNSRVRKIVASSGLIQTVAGTGTPGYNGDNIPANTAEIIDPLGLFVDRAGNVFFNDFGNFRIREVVASTGLIQTVAGSGNYGFSGDGGPATSADLSYDLGVSGDTNGNLFLAETFSLRVREVFGIVPADTLTTTYCFTGVPFNTCSNATGTIPCSGNGLTGYFTLAEPLAPNLVSTNGIGGSGDFLPESFSFTDGISTVTNNSIPLILGNTVGFAADTDAQGNLTQWSMYTSQTPQFSIFYGGPQNVTQEGVNAANYQSYYEGSGTGGVWTKVNGSASACVSPLTIITTSLPLGQVATPYSATLQAVSGTSPYTWSLISGSLPPGFSALSSSGVISGVPTTVGTSSFAVQVADNTGHVATQNFTLTVTPEGATLLSLAVAPTNPTISTKLTEQFLAIGTYNDGSTQNLTSAVNWSSATTTVATVNSSGAATGATAGTSTITATLGTVTGSTVLTVIASAPTAYIGSAVSANCCLDAVNPSTNSVIKSIPVTTVAEPIGVTPNQTRIYLSDYANNLIDVVDATTNTLVTSIPVGASPNAVVVTPNGQFGYVADGGDNNVSVFNVATNALVATIPIGFPSVWVTVTPDGSSVYAGSASTNQIAVISTSTNALSSTFSVAPPSGGSPAGCIGGPIFNAAGTIGYIWQSCLGTQNGSVTVISVPSNTTLATIPVGVLSYQAVLTPDGSRLYVVNAGSNNVSVINTSTNAVIATIPVGNTPQSIAVTPDGTLVYVANTKDSTVSTIQTSTNTVSTTFSLTTPFGIVFVSPPAASQATTLTLNPPNLIFGSQLVGTTSGTLSTTVSNPGTPAVSFSSIALTGPNVSDFVLSNACPTTGTLAGGSSCNLTVAFKPTAATGRTAFVTITSNNGLASSTQSIPLSGQGSLIAAFSGLTPSQSIFAGTTSITLSGVISSGTIYPAAGETVTITIGAVTQTATIGTNGIFSTSFPTATLASSPTPYTITYSYPGDANLTPVTNTSTTLTVNPVEVVQYTLTVTDLGTGNGTVTDNLQQISCTTTGGTQSGTCSASYPVGTPVTLTATATSNSTFAGWGGACSGTAGCVVTMNSNQSVTASFIPPPQLINVTFNPGSNVSGMATYDCPSNPNPSPSNPCTDPNAHALTLSVPQVLQPFTLTVQATEIPPSQGNGLCPTGATPAQDFECRFVTFFTYQTTSNGEVVPLCYPYANGNCVHYLVYSGTPGTEPNPADYVGPIDWLITYNNDTFVPPAPYTGSTPHMYDDPDYAVTPTSPYGTNCSTPMLINGNPTNPPIYCQFEFDITTGLLPGKKVDEGVTGRTRAFNDVTIAFPPANVGNLTITDAPLATPVTAGSPIGYTITVTNSAGGAVTGATLSDLLPAGTSISWSISPAYTGPGTCAITGAAGSQALSCSFGTIAASQTFTIGLLSSGSTIGTYTDTATTRIGNQQILSIGTVAVQGVTATFSGLTPSQSISAGTTSINLSGVIGNGTSYPTPGETVSITIGSVTQTATIGSKGVFNAAFHTASIPASTTPYAITYTYTSDGIFTSAKNNSTTLTVNSVTSALVISPASVNFGQVPLGGLVLKEVTLKNSGSTPINISKIAMSKTGVGDIDDFFVISLCPGTLKPGASCVLGVGYVPDRDDAIGKVASTSVEVVDNVAGSPQSIPLSAETINPRATLSTTYLSFGNQKAGTTSSGKTVTLTSVGTSPLKLHSITVTGEYVLASGTTCEPGMSLTPSQSCRIVVEFKPTKTGILAGAVNISDNTVLGRQTIFLTGKGD